MHKTENNIDKPVDPRRPSELSTQTLAQICIAKAVTQTMPSLGLSAVAKLLADATHDAMIGQKHGNLAQWLQAYFQLPNPTDTAIQLDQPAISVYGHSLRSEDYETSLRALMPWRKGPFQIGDLYIDTEWRSDKKWDRLISHIQPLQNRRVLDVGCGNGYHLWRMLGESPELALGIDPGLLFNVQFAAINHFANSEIVAVLPLRLDQMPPAVTCFDTAFSMGVLYHRQDPMEHLAQLAATLRPGGELVLESLVMPPGYGVLSNPERYSRMRNIGKIPDPETMVKWVEQSGFTDVRVVSDVITTLAEQRTTDWMRSESLAESLIWPSDPRQIKLQDAHASITTDSPLSSALLTRDTAIATTVEGLPPPRRAVVLGTRK